MVFKIVSMVLVVSLLHASMAAQTQPPLQTVPKMQQILRKARDKDKAVKISLNQAVDNRLKFSGKVSEISETGFTFTDQKTGKTLQVTYAQIQEVQQKGMSRTAKILLVSGIVVGTVIGIGFALACSSDSGPNC